MTSGENIKYQQPKNRIRKLKTIKNPGQEFQIDVSGKLDNKKLNGENQILIATDRFSKWPTVNICKSLETKEVLTFKKNQLIELPQKKND